MRMLLCIRRNGGGGECELATNPQVILQAQSSVWKTIKLPHFTSQYSHVTGLPTHGLFPRWEFWNREHTNFRNSSLLLSAGFLLFTSSFSGYSRLSRLAVMSLVCEPITLNIQVLEPPIVLKAPSLQYRAPGHGSWYRYHIARVWCLPT